MNNNIASPNYKRYLSVTSMRTPDEQRERDQYAKRKAEQIINNINGIIVILDYLRTVTDSEEEKINFTLRDNKDSRDPKSEARARKMENEFDKLVAIGKTLGYIIDGREFEKLQLHEAYDRLTEVQIRLYEMYPEIALKKSQEATDESVKKIMENGQAQKIT